MDTNKFSVPDTGNQAGNIQNNNPTVSINKDNCAKVASKPLSLDEAKANAKLTGTKANLNKPLQTATGSSN